MNKRKSGIVMTAVLTFAVGSTSLAAPAGSMLAAGDNENKAKTGGDAVYTSAENVYAALAADGSFQNAYVVNSYDVKRAGEITSYGTYDSVKNLTTLKAIQTSGGVQTFSAEEGRFYYQGDSDSLELPWNVSITYYLDGKQVSAEELAGKSGALEIKMKTEKNPSADPEFYENYMLQVTYTLDMDHCSNIKAEGASVAEAGSSKTVIFTVLPDSDADISLKADVTDFEMTGASIAAVPFSMTFDMPDTSEMSEGLTTLADAIQQLNDGTKELSSGMGLLSSNAAVLRDGSAVVGNGLDVLSANSGTLVDASSQIQSALQMINAGISQVDIGESTVPLDELLDALYTLSGVLDQAQDEITKLPDYYEEAFQEIKAAIENLPNYTPISEEELQALAAAAASSPEAQKAYEALLQNANAAQLIQAIKEQMEGVEIPSDPDAALQVFAEMLGQAKAGVDQMIAKISEAKNMAAALGELQGGMALLSENYTQFHTGLVGYTSGVNALASGYTELNSGLNTYLDGVETASEGTKLLESGVNELAVNTENIPEEMQEQMDEFMAAYDFDFEPVSFMDSRNQNVEAVQFVISTTGIKMEEAEKVVEEPEEEKGIVEKLKALFL